MTYYVAEFGCLSLFDIPPVYGLRYTVYGIQSTVGLQSTVYNTVVYGQSTIYVTICTLQYSVQ